MRLPRKLHGIITIVIVFLIAIAYLLTNSPEVQQVLAQSSALPLYRTSSDTVCLLTVCQADKDALMQLSAKAAKAGVPLTIAVTSDLVEDCAQSLAQIVSMGHSVVLYGTPKRSGETSAQWMERTNIEAGKLEAAIGAKTALYLPYLGQYTKEASRLCQRYRFSCLLYCKDSRTYAAKTPESFAKMLSEKAEQGDIIYIAADGTTDFESIAKSFAEKNLRLGTVEDAGD